MSQLKQLFTLLFILIHVFAFAQSKHYYILFSARFPSLSPFSIGGHAFVTWRSEDADSTKTDQFTYGFYPKKGGGIFKDVDGMLISGYVKNSNKERLVRRFIIEVDSSCYFETLKSVNEWKKEAYNLFNRNCVDFIDEIAAKLGLERPKTKNCLFPRKPQKYIKLLKRLNPSRIIQNEYLENVRIRILRRAKVKHEEVEVDD